MRIITAISCTLMLVSCAPMGEVPGGSNGDGDAVQAPATENDSGLQEAASNDLSSSAAELAMVSDTSSKLAEPVFYKGNDRQVNLPAVQEPFRLIGEDVSLNFEQAPLAEVVHAIMGDILGLDYIIDGPVTGEVTLRSRTPLPRSELLNVLESLLKANNTLMIHRSDDRFLITSSQLASRLSPSVSNANNTGPGYSTIVVPLQYVSAVNMAEILAPLAEDSAFVRIDNIRNILMLAGTREQLLGWLDIVSTFDVDLLKGMSVGMFPVENVSVEEINEALAGLLGAAPGANGEGSSDFSHLVRIIPFKRLNSIMVVSPRAHYLEQVKTWVERLDKSPASSLERRLFVYPVQNTTASRLAELLTNIYSGSGTKSGGGGGGGRSGGGGGNIGSYAAGASSTAPGLTPEKMGSSSSRASTQTAFSSSVASLDSSSAAPSAFDEVRVVADDENNALMIYATQKNFKKIEDALDELDVVATQIIIEASILEVSLTDELKYGLEWTFKGGLGDSYDGLGLLAAAAEGPAAVVPGFSYTVTNSLGDVSAVLNALATNSLINVISTPSVMVMDNHTAFIHVGDQVPTFSAQTITDGGRTTQSVEYKDTGVKLSVKPSVNAGGLVTMDIEQSVTDIGQIDAATGQRAFLERHINSRVAVRSNESVVLGGLIRENATDSSGGIPFLHSLPLVGGLFGTVEDSTRRTELLVIITPRALYNQSELREVSEEMRSHIRHMELIEIPAEIEGLK